MLSSWPAVPRLPSDDEFNCPVTLDLNGSVAIRAKAADQPRPTEVVLTGSDWSGEPIRINTNRKYLARAVKLGFRELFVYGDNGPMLCQDEPPYVWARWSRFRHSAGQRCDPHRVAHGRCRGRAGTWSSRAECT